MLAWMPTRPVNQPDAARPRIPARPWLIALGCGLALIWSWARLRDSDAGGVLLRAAARGTAEERLMAIDELGHRPPGEVAAVVPGLIRALGDADPGVREHAALALGRTIQFGGPEIRGDGTEADAAIRAMAARRDDHSPAVRHAVAMSVSLCTGPAREAPSRRLAAETLRALIRDRAAEVRFAAAVALDERMYRGPETLDAFLDAAHDDDPAVRHLALSALRRDRVVTPRAHLAFSRAFDHTYPEIHRLGEEWLADNLDRLDPAEVVPRLVAKMAFAAFDPGWRLDGWGRGRTDIRGNAAPHCGCAQILGWLDARSMSALPYLAAWSTRPGRRGLRTEAAMMLGVNAPGSPEARAALPLLLEDFRSEIRSDRWAASSALQAFTWSEEPVVELLCIEAQGMDRYNMGEGTSGSAIYPRNYPRPRSYPRPIFRP